MATRTPRKGMLRRNSCLVWLSTYHRMKAVTATGMAAKTPARNVVRRCFFMGFPSFTAELRNSTAAGLQSGTMIGKGDDEGRLRKLRGSRRGVLTIIAIFVVGGIFVAGLYVAARRGVPEEYRSSQVGTPT